ncbi:RTA1 like protein-domain-containing protein [Fomitopsis serialis]|uniref:RTA1 like protein-domain-containing protein n=1 Tax=Fomitopsis serialis TaxID=139415 RepID=UPI0020084B4A|nr:RTA1 like protein-domain-containing protein [Neoantrodia serialis]KAH9912224.1 RTA1 like protein-domain-containing protein [Neoantrodia serialis]
MTLQARKLLKHNPYGYVPTEWICILFLVLFAVTTVLHTVQAVRYRLWFLLYTACLAGVLELVGWSGREWSAHDILQMTPYLMQIVCTIIAPTPFVAAMFVVLGEMIRRLGSCYSRLGTRAYTIVFCSCDVIALVIQAVGGVFASTAVARGESAQNGGHIMLAGICFQLGAFSKVASACRSWIYPPAVAITFYMILASEFVVRCLLDKPLRAGDKTVKPATHTLDRKHAIMLGALAFASICIYIRSIYRTIELADGWTGHIIRTQRYFDWLDGGMVAFAMFTLNSVHPGVFLGPGRTWNAKADAPVSQVEAICLDNQSGYASRETLHAKMQRLYHAEGAV